MVGRDRYVGPVPVRRRVSKQLRAEIVEYYRQGLSSLDVAEVLGVGKSTVLNVLKAAGEPIRPRGVRYR